jgi:hypothetical protein
MSQSPSQSPRRAPRILGFPYAEQLFDARLDHIGEVPSADVAGACDVVFDIAVLRLADKVEPVTVDGEPGDRVYGVYEPRRLRFPRASWIDRSGPFADFSAFNALQSGADARRLMCIVHLDGAPRGERYVVVTHESRPHEFTLRASSCLLEEREGAPEPVVYVRKWAAAPLPPVGRLSVPLTLHARFGGDPIAIRLGERRYRTRLFIGGFRQQGHARPGVDHVVNLSGMHNRWVESAGWHPDDRYRPKGEMAAGMRTMELLAEAAWVAEALRSGKRVLIHCAAGINRSATLCCATLMVLEGLSAEEALARVRERHAEAHPDPYHWYALRHLEQLLAAGLQASELAKAPVTARERE